MAIAKEVAFCREACGKAPIRESLRAFGKKRDYGIQPQKRHPVACSSAAGRRVYLVHSVGCSSAAGRRVYLVHFFRTLLRRHGPPGRRRRRRNAPKLTVATTTARTGRQRSGTLVVSLANTRPKLYRKSRVRLSCRTSRDFSGWHRRPGCRFSKGRATRQTRNRPERLRPY
jgi:hypothetical protein